MSQGSLHLPTLLFQVACWLWWSVSEMISWQLYLYILVARTKIKIMHFSHFLFIWHVFIHVRRADMQTAHTIYASHRSHMLQPGSPISRGVSASSRVGLCRRTCTHTSPWRCLMDQQGRLGPAMSATSCLVSRVMLGWARPGAQNVLLHSWQ